MKKIIYTFLFVLIYATTVGQKTTIKGTIFDAETKEPILGTSVQLLNNLDVGTITDAVGNFQLDVAKNANQLLKIQRIGYEIREIVADSIFLQIALYPKTEQLQSVVVTANREVSLRSETPVAISTLSAKLIDESKATQAFELINKVPGVLMVSLNNEQHMMAIRQPITTNAYYLYLEDGIPIRPLGIFNHNALLEVNQFAISSIEVIKGPVSSIYGAEAVGGTVNFIMQRPTSVSTAKAGIQLDNFGFKRIQFGTGTRVGKFGFYVAGLVGNQVNSWMANSDYDKSTVNARLEYHFSASTRLVGNVVYSNYFSSTAGSVDSISFYNRQYVSTTDFTYRKSWANRTRLTFERDWRKGAKTFITLFNRNNEHGQNPTYQIKWNPVASPTNDPTKASGQINALKFQSYGLILQHSQLFKFAQSKLIVGGMYDHSPTDYFAYQIDLTAKLRPGGKSVEKYTIFKENSDLKLTNYDAKINNMALYMQYDFVIAKGVRFSTGARYDVMSFTYNNYVNQTDGSKEYSQLTPKIGITYDVGKGIGVYANYSQGFSPPALTIIFSPKPNTKPVVFNYNLKPAQFENIEVGGWAAVVKNKIYFDLAAYQMVGINELLNIRQPDNSYDYQSAGKTVHQGIEYGITVKPSSPYLFRFGGTVAQHKFDDFQISTNPKDKYQNLGGYEMPKAPRTMFNTEFYYYPPFVTNLRTSLEWQYISGWYQNSINTFYYEGYQLINYRVGYRLKSVEVYANVLNVGNFLYATNVERGNNPTDRATFSPAAPRTFVFGIQYNFAGKNN